MSVEFHEPAIAIGGYVRVNPAVMAKQGRGAKSVKRRRKLLLESFDEQPVPAAMLSTTTTSSFSSSASS